MGSISEKLRREMASVIRSEGDCIVEVILYLFWESHFVMYCENTANDTQVNRFGRRKDSNCPDQAHKYNVAGKTLQIPVNFRLMLTPLSLLVLLIPLVPVHVLVSFAVMALSFIRVRLRNQIDLAEPI